MTPRKPRKGFLGVRPSTQSSEDQSPSPNAEGVSAGKSARDEIQQPPTQGEIEGLVELAAALKRGDYGAWDDDWLVGKFNEATDRLRSLLGELAEAGMYTEAHRLLDEDARERVAVAEASLLRVTEERDEANRQRCLLADRALAEAERARTAEARLASLREEVEIAAKRVLSLASDGRRTANMPAIRRVGEALISRPTQETRQTEGES